MRRNGNWKWILFGILLIALLLVVGCSQQAEPGETGAGEEAEVAAPAALSLPTRTASPTPTKTPTPTPVLTPTSTPEADPRLELGQSAWGAVFEDGTETWYQYDHVNGMAEVRDNMLVLTSKQANGYDNWSMSYPPMEDFYLELRFTTGPECEGKDRFGILFRAPDSTQGYLYNVSCDGFFQARMYDGDEFTDFIPWTPDEHILTGPEVEHRLGVWAEGDRYVLYINGFQIGEFTDDAYLGEGTFGAVHGATDTEGFTVMVTEAKAWELPEAAEE